MSKLQSKVSLMLSNHIGHTEIYENIRPEWLQMDDGTRLELDFYIPDLKSAIEVQGEQHYRYTPFFHATYDDFLARIERDKAKRAVCENAGIALFEVTNEDEALEIVLGLAGNKPDTLLHPNAAKQILQSIGDCYTFSTTKDKRLSYAHHMKRSPYPKRIRNALTVLFDMLMICIEDRSFKRRRIAVLEISLKSIARYESIHGRVIWDCSQQYPYDVTVVQVAKDIVSLHQGVSLDLIEERIYSALVLLLRWPVRPWQRKKKRKRRNRRFAL